MTSTVVERFHAKYEIVEPGGCWVWMGTIAASGGYGGMGIGSRSDGTRRTARAHRLSWEIHNGPIPDGLYVLHRCDVPCCVNPAHLRLGDHAENMADMVKKGRSPKSGAARGELNHEARLNRAQVNEIRSLSGRLCRSAIGRRFGISGNHAGQIIRGERWGWLSCEGTR